jgi:hypothetical protein
MAQLQRQRAAGARGIDTMMTLNQCVAASSHLPSGLRFKMSADRSELLHRSISPVVSCVALAA